MRSVFKKINSNSTIFSSGKAPNYFPSTIIQPPSNQTQNFFPSPQRKIRQDQIKTKTSSEKKRIRSRTTITRKLKHLLLVVFFDSESTQAIDFGTVWSTLRLPHSPWYCHSSPNLLPKKSLPCYFYSVDARRNEALSIQKRWTASESDTCRTRVES